MELSAQVHHRWDVTPTEAVALQRELRERVVLQPPPGLRVERVAGADVSTEQGRDTGFGGIVVLDAGTLVPAAQAGSAATLGFP